MTRKQLLLVVDDNKRFAVHVWRQLSGAMEYGFQNDSGDGPFVRTSPDGRLKVQWWNARTTPTLDAFITLCRDLSLEVWCVLDVQGVVGDDASIEGWKSYRAAFEEAADPSHLFVMSSYGHGGWGRPAIYPKTPESFHRLAQLMELSESAREATIDAALSDADVNVLITGAGFEFQERIDVGVSIGCPSTEDVLYSMRPEGKALDLDHARHDARQRRPFPLLRSFGPKLAQAARDRHFDDYWDIVLRRLNIDHDPRGKELAWRDAFRRALLAYDFGYQQQSLIAAQLDWDIWLSTNYTRFADRAIDRVANVTQKRSWRTIASRPDADDVLHHTDYPREIRAQHRWLIKLRGDIGHVSTMAIAGHDKAQTSSELKVKPNLQFMYATAEALVQRALSSDDSETRRCDWHIVGHGLQDAQLVQSLALGLKQSNTSHRLIYVSPGIRVDTTLELLRTRFKAADAAATAERLVLEGHRGPSNSIVVRAVDCTALEYMARLTLPRAAAAESEPSTPTPLYSYVRETTRGPSDAGERAQVEAGMHAPLQRAGVSATPKTTASLDSFDVSVRAPGAPMPEEDGVHAPRAKELNGEERTLAIEPVRVFISYAHEDDDYRKLVQGFAARLRKDEVESRLDEWHLDGRPFESFMSSEMRSASKILVLFSPKYREGVHRMQDGGAASGRGYEAMLLGNLLTTEYEKYRRRVVYVIARGTAETAVPQSFRGFQYHALSLEAFDEAKYGMILARLLDETPAPPRVQPRKRRVLTPIKPLRGKKAK